VVFETGARPGDGVIVITYTPVPPSPPTPVVPTAIVLQPTFTG
jgi:hypothetical protein